MVRLRRRYQCRSASTLVRRERWAIGVVALAALLVATACSSASDPAAVPLPGEDATATSSSPDGAIGTDPTTTAVEQPTSVPATDLPTPPPTTTPDPLVAEAEETAVAYFLAIHRIAADARVADASEAIRMEAVGSPLENYALRLINETLKSNDYIDFDEIEWSLVGSEVVDVNGGAVDVFICVQSSGEWRDFDTDEITKQASSDPFTFVYDVRSDGEGTGPKVWAFDDTDDDGNVIPCEVHGGET